MQLAIRFAAAVALVGLCATSVVAQGVSVTINGQPAGLSPAPIERAGRVFVPLRGVFEKLGASVVYSGGQINAQGNNRAISLKIGSTQASVNGQPTAIDVAPFIIGASTYVPLRFVAEALGANVNWDNSNRLVAITTSGNVAPPAQTITAQPSSSKSPLTLTSINPPRGGYVASVRPTISAGFANGTADPNSLRITLDQLDITNGTTRAPNGIIYSPPSDLASQTHTVHITGKDSNGLPIDRSWSFTSGTAQVQNFIRNLTPANGASVPATFTVTGATQPGSTVVIDAGSQLVVGGVFALGGDHSRIETTADAGGNFSKQVQLNAGPGQTVTLVVTSTEPQTKSSVKETRKFTIGG